MDDRTRRRPEGHIGQRVMKHAAEIPALFWWMQSLCLCASCFLCGRLMIDRTKSDGGKYVLVAPGIHGAGGRHGGLNVFKYAADKHQKAVAASRAQHHEYVQDDDRNRWASS